MITLEESRYARQELITWWDQAALARSRVLVVGAGALGNEIVKNLALLGVGRLDIVDMDRIERSNLSRAALFRDSDEGRLKAEALADAAHALNPETTAVAHPVSVMTLGLGFLAEFDLVIAGLDNREARLWIGQATRKLGMAWVDGAIEGLRGLARVFLPEGACYECTLGETDRQILAARKSCALLSADEMLAGKTPTNSTSASIIAGIQVQEAVKLLVGRPDLLALRNQAYVYTGDTLDSYVTGYTEDDWCLSHDRYEHLETRSGVSCLADLVDEASTHLGDPDAVDLESELILARRCNQCGWTDTTIRPLPALGRGDGECPRCRAVLTFEAARSLKPDDPVLTRPLGELRLADLDVVTVRAGTQRRHYILRSTP